MPAPWTGDIVGILHNNGLTRKELAAHLGMNDKYVLAVLNGKRCPKGAEDKFRKAVNELISKKDLTAFKNARLTKPD